MYCVSVSVPIPEWFYQIDPNRKFNFQSVFRIWFENDNDNKDITGSGSYRREVFEIGATEGEKQMLDSRIVVRNGQNNCFGSGSR